MAFRGGRGGGRGGRGGGGNGGPMMPREFDVKPDFGPTEQFPDYAIPFQDPLSATERIRIARFRDHRDKVHNGPLYTVFSKKRGLEDPFEDVATYSSKRYHRQKRKVPKLDARPYVFEFFPTELWETMDASYAPGGDRSVVLNGKKEKKRLLIASLNTALPNGGLRNGDMGSDESGDEGDGDGDGDDEDPQKDKKKSVLANLMKHKDDEEEDAVSGDDADREDDDDREDGIEEEDDYQDDEEGDYNAEQYFDDGDREVDYGDDDGGGGGGAWYD